MVDKKLVKYIKKTKAQGFSFQRIHDHLVQHGYKSKNIHKAIKKTKNHFTGKLTLLIIFLLLITITSAALIYFNTAKSVCGNGSLEKGETTNNCCLDVGCLGEQTCENNICKDPICGDCQYLKDNVCRDYECCDNNNCSINEKCKNNKCINLVCSSCQYTENHACIDYICCSDKDCDDSNINTKDVCLNPKTTSSICSNKLLDKCQDNLDCDDSDSSTTDVCSGIPKKCSNIKIISCVDGDGYCPAGCIFNQDNDCISPDVISPDHLNILYLSDPFYSLKPITGKRKILTILWDPHRLDHPAPTKNEVKDLIFGTGKSVKNYFYENSGGKFTIENVEVAGWFDANYPWQFYWRNSPYTPEDVIGTGHHWVDTEGKYGTAGKAYYLDGEGFISGHSHKWAEAILKADAQFDFSQYDLDGNKLLSPNELSVLIVIPQNNPFGTQRPVVAKQLPKKEALIVDGIEINVMVEAYIGNPLSMGLVAHELSHILLGTGDMYFSFFQPYASGLYSLMDQAHLDPSHLDPFHKLKLSWLKTREVVSNGWYELPDIETSQEVLILRNSTKSDKEYFIIENRWKGNSYDNIPDNGLAIWHIIEDSAIFSSLPVPSGVDPQQYNDPGWGGWARKGIRMIRPIYGPPINWALWDGSDPSTGYDLLSVDPDPNHVTLTWADGTPSGFSIKHIPPANSKMVFYIEVN